MIGENFVGTTIAPLRADLPAALAEHPVLRLVFGHSLLVYVSLAMTVAVAWFLKRTRAGLILRAVGENDHSAHSIGYSVIGVRYAAVAFGGAMAGLGGCYYSMVQTPMWAEELTAGRGWIALALVVFAAWQPVAAAARRLSLRRGDDLRAAGQGRGHQHRSRRSSWRRCPTSRRSSCWR